MRSAPAVSCANMCKEAHTSETGTDGAIRHSLRNGLRLMPCSPRRRIRLVTVACKSGFGRTRLGSKNLCKLGTSNGCRDHTVLPYARYVVRPARRGVAHEPGSPCDRDRADALASTASRPAFVTTRDPPLLSERDGAERAID